MRIDGRLPDEHRKVRIVPGFQAFAEGSALIEAGRTRVLCSVTVEERLPAFLRGGGQGWITAEYGMLPRSTITRTPREWSSGRPDGRSFEIQRLIGRSLRAITDLQSIGERTLTVDCDVLQADGGTRVASITGAYVALYQAFLNMIKKHLISSMPLKCAVAATSVGLVDDQLLLDLCYEEDYRAQVDFNVVMTDKGDFVEIQGTAEGSPFSRDTIDKLLAMSQKGLDYLFQAQRGALQCL
ncbi:MAG: ribonuclease PH [Chloroflexi bacterium]|nr:ribonuclease PH [Chloroflexota bacterium]